jgi:hypothetical protein
MTKSNLATIELDLLATVAGAAKEPVDGWGSNVYSHNKINLKEAACHLTLLGCTLVGPNEPEHHPGIGSLVGPGNPRPPITAPPPPKPTPGPLVTIE